MTVNCSGNEFIFRAYSMKVQPVIKAIKVVVHVNFGAVLIDLTRCDKLYMTPCSILIVPLCKDCGGSGICQHGKDKRVCKDC